MSQPGAGGDQPVRRRSGRRRPQEAGCRQMPSGLADRHGHSDHPAAPRSPRRPRLSCLTRLQPLQRSRCRRRPHGAPLSRTRRIGDQPQAPGDRGSRRRRVAQHADRPGADPAEGEVRRSPRAAREQRQGAAEGRPVRRPREPSDMRHGSHERDISPWSRTTTNATGQTVPGNRDATPSTSFAITQAADGGACASQLPFAPGLTAGMASSRAAAFSQLATTVNRRMGSRRLQKSTCEHRQDFSASSPACSAAVSRMPPAARVDPRA